MGWCVCMKMHYNARLVSAASLLSLFFFFSPDFLKIDQYDQSLFLITCMGS